MLEARDMTIGYGEKAIVRRVSLAVRAGATLALVGANGAGKTTLLRALNGALPLRSGEILLDGKSLTEFSRREIARRITVVAQENQTAFPLTVREFVLAGRFAHGGAFGWETPHDLNAAQTALRETNLEDFANRNLNELSGGERQRVVLARALATEAKLFLLDEPTANLDVAQQAAMLKLIRRKCDETDAAAIVVTHDLNLAAEFADEILLLKTGETVTSGAPATVLTEDNLRTAFGVETLLDRHPISGRRRVTIVY